MEPFYEQLDEATFASSPSTAAPWGPDRQHAGPPSTLLARAIERFEPRESHRLGRVHVDTLGAVPVAPLRVSVERLRTGRRLELFEAEAAADNRVVLVALPGDWPGHRRTSRPAPSATPSVHRTCRQPSRFAGTART